MTKAPDPASTADERRDALVGKLFGATIEALDLLSVYLGDQLGLYRALAGGPLTAPELAAAAGIHERYAREWLEQQAASGILDVEAEADRSRRASFSAPRRPRRGAPRSREPRLRDAVRTGTRRPGASDPRRDPGVPRRQRCSRTRTTARISTKGRPPSRGRSTRTCSAGMAARRRRRPRPPPSGTAGPSGRSRLRRRHVEHRDREGVPEGACRRDRLRRAVDRAREAESRRGTGRRGQGRLPLPRRRGSGSRRPVRPRDDLRGAPRHVVPGRRSRGSSPVARGRRDRHRVRRASCRVVHAPADEVERLLYGASILHCLLVGMVGEAAAGTGTVMRPDTLRGYAEAAGFRSVEVLPIEHRLLPLLLASVPDQGRSPARATTASPEPVRARIRTDGASGGA